MSEVESNTSYEMFLLKRLWDRTLTEKDIMNVINQMAKHLPPPIPEVYPDLSLDQVYESHIRSLLIKHGNDRRLVSNILKINIKTLYNKMQMYGIKQNEYSKR